MYKSDSNRVIGGVCGGLGEYFGIDPIIFRIIAVVLIFFHGAGLLLYLIAWICMPKRRTETFTNGQYYGAGQYDQQGQNYQQGQNWQQNGPQQGPGQATNIGDQYR